MTSETPTEKRRRLRWITLAELIGVLALLISAAGYWDSHRERVQAGTAPKARAAPLLLTGKADGTGETLALTAHGDAVVQTQSLSFPTSVRADAVETTGNPRIEASWFVEGLRKALPDREGSGPRLPVGIVTTYVNGDETRTDAAIYDVGYSLHDRLLRGRAVQLEGLTLVRRVPAASLRAAVDARWAKAVPAKP